jgi:hypothetical protein
VVRPFVGARGVRERRLPPLSIADPAGVPGTNRLPHYRQETPLGSGGPGNRRTSTLFQNEFGAGHNLGAVCWTPEGSPSDSKPGTPENLDPGGVA